MGRLVVAKAVTGFSLSEGVKEKLQGLARARGRSASAVVEELIVSASSKRAASEVLVDGIRYVPARGRRS